MRAASIITADPAPLSVAPVPECHESKCAPSMTISSALSVPGISATMLNEFRSVGVERALDRSFRAMTGRFLASVRAIRL